MSDFELVWDTRCDVAEIAAWDPVTRRLLFADIDGKRINALTIDTGAHQTWDFPETVGSSACAGRLVCRPAPPRRAVRSDVRCPHRPDTEVGEPLTNRFNDGKVGPDGAFWVGTLDGNSPRQTTASLYRVTADGRITEETGGCQNSNGLAWSPDGRTMYHSDSTAGFIEAWDFDPATGARHATPDHREADQRDGRPDGAATDMDGNYWSAGPSAG